MSWFVFYAGISAVACRIALPVTCFDTLRFRRANSVARMSAVYVAICEFFKISSRFDYLLVGFSMVPLANAVVHSPNQYTRFLCYSCQNVPVECGVRLWQWTRTNLRFSYVAVVFILLLYHHPRQLLYSPRLFVFLDITGIYFVSFRLRTHIVTLEIFYLPQNDFLMYSF